MTAKKRGAFLVLEGLDGAGKNSNARNIENYLSHSDIPHFVASEYKDSPFCRELRTVLNNQSPQLDPITETMLFYASRIEHTKHIIRPYLERGYLVVSDRYCATTAAYQGARTERVPAVHALADSLLVKPDLTLFYDIPVEIYEQRVLKRDGKLDQIEGRGVEYFTKVRANFHAWAADDPSFIIIDASQPLDDVFAESIRHVDDFLRNFA